MNKFNILFLNFTLVIIFFPSQIFFSQNIQKTLRSRYSGIYYFGNSINSNHIHRNSWKSFGPLNIYIDKIIRKREIVLIPALNSMDKPIYLSINCLDKIINTTGKDFLWKEWKRPLLNFEKSLIEFSCNFVNHE